MSPEREKRRHFKRLLSRSDDALEEQRREDREREIDRRYAAWLLFSRFYCTDRLYCQARVLSLCVHACVRACVRAGVRACE